LFSELPRRVLLGNPEGIKRAGVERPGPKEVVGLGFVCRSGVIILPAA